MARYVCDFDTVKTEAGKIVTAAGEMSSALNTYVTNVKEHLTGWGGTSAKKAFEATNEDQVTVTNTHITEIEEVGNFIKSACEKIETLEENLGGMNI